MKCWNPSWWNILLFVLFDEEEEEEAEAAWLVYSGLLYNHL